ncbi:MAG TPA: hypothetical protein VHB79_28120 [Polyangiaceae bacterium]|nr:hypothetical protein [Polyangiaceae bacterium]
MRDVTADAVPEAQAKRLLATDRELIEPELQVEEGQLSNAAGAPVARFALRITKRTLQLSEPLEASVSVIDGAGKAHPFRVVSKDVLRSEGGMSEPGGSWSEQQTLDGEQLTWLPGDLPAPTGERELVVAIEVDGETHLLSARFAVGSGSPITLGRVTEHRRTGVLEIDVEAESKRAYSCELSANLFDMAGTPLQHTTWTGSIGPGTSHASLQFSQDIQADTHTLTAPIIVRQFRGSCRPSDAPDEPALAVPLLEELYRTPS